jgi:hypothetical protein
MRSPGTGKVQQAPYNPAGGSARLGGLSLAVLFRGNRESLRFLIPAFDCQPRRSGCVSSLRHPGVHNKNLVAPDRRFLITADVSIFCAVRMPENGSAANVSHCDVHRQKQRVVRLAPSSHQRAWSIPPGSDGGQRWQKVRTTLPFLNSRIKVSTSDQTGTTGKCALANEHHSGNAFRAALLSLAAAAYAT